MRWYCSAGPARQAKRRERWLQGTWHRSFQGMMYTRVAISNKVPSACQNHKILISSKKNIRFPYFGFGRLSFLLVFNLLMRGGARHVHRCQRTPTIWCEISERHCSMLFIHGHDISLPWSWHQWLGWLAPPNKLPTPWSSSPLPRRYVSVVLWLPPY